MSPIDADEVREKMLKLLDHHLMMCNYSADSATQDCIEVINEAAVVDAEPVVHGRWIKSDFLRIGANQYRCSKCWEDEWWLYHFSLGDSKYCPNCGAKMDEVSE